MNERQGILATALPLPCSSGAAWSPCQGSFGFPENLIKQEFYSQTLCCPDQGSQTETEQSPLVLGDHRGRKHPWGGRGCHDLPLCPKLQDGPPLPQCLHNHLPRPAWVCQKLPVGRRSLRVGGLLLIPLDCPCHRCSNYCIIKDTSPLAELRAHFPSTYAVGCS